MAAAGLALLRGHPALGLALAGAALMAASGKTFHAPFNLGGKRRVRGASVELDFNNFGVRDGAILGGPFAGWRLSEMSRVDCEAFYGQCQGGDPSILLALEAYFDRRFPGWRTTGQGDPHAGDGGLGPGNGEMTEKEAYQTLGIRPGSSAEEIARAYRALMKERHPDYGGTTDGAARLNQAKDRLLRRHG